NRAPHGVGAASETPAPERIAEDGHAMATLDLIVRSERTSPGRSDAEHVEEAGSDARRPEIFGLRSGLAQGEGAVSDCRHGLEHLLLRRPVEVILRCDARKRVGIVVLRAPRPRRVTFTDGA